MKKQNGDALAMGTRRAVLAAAVSLYAAMAGAQTNPATPAALYDSSARLVIAQALPFDCPSWDTLNCRRDISGPVIRGGFGVAAAAGGLGSTSSSGSQGSGNGTSSAGGSG
ncbi:hypothetical protein A6V37_26935 [Paraburkholderia ginsengiterrae]|uniref:Uncharacterized protein n=2 Tax=Paraburkholderia ginsengiterrae TaxID=1462993 RepID=A0A1A9N821_9BURK|nr:hypothetical protein A6V37_26935 [Paraburkholderia ginsengiterrae]